MGKQKLFFNGNIISVDNHQEYGAVLIEDNKIIGVGSLQDMQAKANDQVQQIDLQGLTLVPGFIDGHSHISMAAESLLLVDLTPANSISELLAIVQKAYDAIPEVDRKPDQFLLGWGYHNSTYPNQEQPTAQELDKISPVMPIGLSNDSGHSAVYNTAALNYFKITEDYKPANGEVVGRYTDGPLKGKLNGFVAEETFWKTQKLTPQPSIQRCVSKMPAVQEIYLAAGLTFGHSGMVTERVFDILSMAAQQNVLKFPIVGYVHQAMNPKLYLAHPEYHNYNNNFKLGGLKMFIDGSPQQKTAWMTVPYLTGPANNYGTSRLTDQEIYDIIKTAIVDYKCPIIIHNNGDAAAQAILKNFSKVREDFGVTDIYRSTLIHDQFMRPDQIASLKGSGMVMSIFVSHIYEWGDIHIQNIGMERTNYMSACHSALDANIPFSFHDDTPVLWPDYMMAMDCAVNRITKNGVQLAESEKISPYEALKAITYNAAYQYGEENNRGSITVGKLANFVVLSDNPLTCDSKKIKDIKVVDTYLEGEHAFHNPAFSGSIQL